MKVTRDHVSLQYITNQRIHAFNHDSIAIVSPSSPLMLHELHVFCLVWMEAGY